jgi:tetratricopeptide (TPR) repeat protein
MCPTSGKMNIQNRKFALLPVIFVITLSGLNAQQKGISDTELTAKLHQLMDSCQYERACLVAGELLGRDSLNIEALTIKGRALAANFQFQQARDVFTRAYFMDTSNVMTLFELVSVCKQLGDSKKAIAYCKKLTGSYPENIFFAIQLSNLYYGADDFRKARDILLPLYGRDSLNSYVIKQLANSLSELQLTDSAISFYRKYLDIVPNDAGITGKLTNLYIRKRDFTSGKNLTDQFLSHDSSSTGILKLNAYCNYLLKEYPVAVRQFSISESLGDRSSFTLKYLGLSLYRQEMYELAEPWFRMAYLADTADMEVCFYYGVSAYRSSLPDTGIVYLEKTMRMILPDPKFLNTLTIELAGAYTANGQIDTALTILKSAYKANPDYPVLAFNIAYQYDYYLQSPSEALPYYKEFLNKCPESEKSEVSSPLHRSYYEYSLNRVKEIKDK